MEEEASRAFMVLSDYVRDLRFIEQHHEAYRMVECSSKAAYGCGPNGDAIVRGLALFVRLGGDNTYIGPELRLRATDEVFRRVGTELDVNKVKYHGSCTRLSGRIYTLDGDVMVLCISFTPSFECGQVSYYLVYDSAAASLSLLPGLPPCCRPACTEFPLKVKVGEAEVDNCRCSLALMAERSTSASAKYTDPVLCLWSPPPPSSPHDDNRRRDYSRRAWDLKARVRVNPMADPFEAHVVFSCKGNAVWGDLAQGIFYCDCSDLVDDDTEPAVFKHVTLPEECRNNMYDIDQNPMPVFRTMGCIGDSVWFVIIEPSFHCPGDTKVKVWTLDLPADEEWNLHTELRMQSLWELFREQGWPETVPDYPILRQQDDVATLYMFLHEPYAGGIPYAHQVCIELSRSSCQVVRLVSSRRVEFTVMQRPLVLDPDFFGPHLHMAGF